MQTYEIINEGRAIKCLECGLTSYNMHDVQQRYCGKCGYHGPEQNRPTILNELLTRREAFAMAALQGMLANPAHVFEPAHKNSQVAGQWAREYADDLLKEMER